MMPARIMSMLSPPCAFVRGREKVDGDTIARTQSRTPAFGPQRVRRKADSWIRTCRPCRGGTPRPTPR